MLDKFIIYLPAAVCLFWILSYSLMVSRTSTYKHMVFLFIVTGLYLFADSSYSSPSASTQVLTVCSLISQLTAPCIIPLLMTSMHYVHYKTPLPSVHLFWITIPVVLFTVELMLVIIAGSQNIEGFLGDLYVQGINVAENYRNYLVHSYYLWSIVAFRIVIVAEILVFTIYIIRIYLRRKYSVRHLFDFLFHGGRISVLELFCSLLVIVFFIGILKVVLFRDILLAHQWIPSVLSSLVAAVTFLLGYIGLFSAKRSVSLSEMKSGFLYNYNDDSKGEFVEGIITNLLDDAEEEALKRIQDKIGRSIDTEDLQAASAEVVEEKPFTDIILGAMADTTDDDSLLARFQHLLLDEQIFLQPGVTLVDVAERLGTNKTYISRLVNNTYNLAFPELMNHLRIDYAEQYIIKHRSAKQSDIAKACGFASASSMNNTFKKVTGMTPKVWIATHDRHNPQR